MVAVIILITVTALPVYADMGAKPSIDLTVENAPDEEYYIDLLMPYPLQDEGSVLESINEQYSGRDAEMIKAIVTNAGDGWSPRHGGERGIGFDFIHSNTEHKYTFSYTNVPERFKVIIVTCSGKVIKSEEFTRKAYNAVITFDAGTGKMSEKMSGWVSAYLVRFFITFLGTLIIEGIVFLCFKYKFGEGNNFVVFILTNFCTQVLLHVSYFFVPVGWISKGIYIVEIIIMVIEAVVYSKLLTPKEKGVRYALIANTISLVLTFPVWIFLELAIPTVH